MKVKSIKLFPSFPHLSAAQRVQTAVTTTGLGKNVKATLDPKTNEVTLSVALPGLKNFTKHLEAAGYTVKLGNIES